MYEVFADCNDRVFTSTWGGKATKAKVIAKSVLGICRIALANNSQKVFACLVLGFFIKYPLTLGSSIVIPDEKSSLNLYLCVYMQKYLYCGVLKINL